MTQKKTKPKAYETNAKHRISGFFKVLLKDSTKKSVKEDVSLRIG